MSAIPELEQGTPSAAFDNIAEIFDQEFENEITRSLRERIYRTIELLVPPGGSVLDVNCGTGIDALALARKGYKVTGIDISQQMIRRARSKAEKEGFADLEFTVGSFENLRDAVGGSYDLVLSNFGGLNCVDHLGTTATEIARVTRPGGYFFATVMPPMSPWEVVAGLARLNTHDAFRRFRKDVMASGFRGRTFTVHYHSVRSILFSFTQWFTVKQILGMNIISPPPHATAFAARHVLLTKWLNRIEALLAPLPGFRSMGDHCLVVLRRKIS